MVSDSIIENKSYTFEYGNQIADFRVIIIDNNEEIKAKNSNFDDLTKGIDMPINIIE